MSSADYLSSADRPESALWRRETPRRFGRAVDPLGSEQMARPKQQQRAEAYTHGEEALLRPDIGTQAQFRKKKPPKTYRVRLLALA